MEMVAVKCSAGMTGFWRHSSHRKCRELLAHSAAWQLECFQIKTLTVACGVVYRDFLKGQVSQLRSGSWDGFHIFRQAKYLLYCAVALQLMKSIQSRITLLTPSNH